MRRAGFEQRGYFGPIQRAVVSNLHPAIGYRSDSGALEPEDLVSEPGQQAADFSVSTFPQRYLQHAAVVSSAKRLDLQPARFAPVQIRRGLQRGHLFFVQPSGNLYNIRLGYPVSRVSEPLGKFAIVCQDYQTG